MEKWKSSENPGARIYEQWKAANMPVRSKKALVERAVEMELVRFVAGSVLTVLLYCFSKSCL